MIINVNSVNKDTNTMRTNAEINSLIDSKIYDKLKIQSGSYIGSGVYGESSPKRLSFNFIPKIVLIWKGDTGFIPYSNEGWLHSLFWVTGATRSVVQGKEMTISISDRTLSIYSNESPTYQMNGSGITYNWIALG